MSFGKQAASSVALLNYLIPEISYASTCVLGGGGTDLGAVSAKIDSKLTQQMGLDGITAVKNLFTFVKNGRTKAIYLNKTTRMKLQVFI